MRRGDTKGIGNGIAPAPCTPCLRGEILKTVMSPIFTIGHSTRPIPDFVELLRQVSVDLLVDVRSVPRSRANPQFNADTLPHSLAAAGIAYRHLAALGGLRGRRKDAAPSPNALWRSDAFRNYADYAET